MRRGRLAAAWLCLLTMLMPVAALAQQPVEVLRLCADEQPLYPWRLADAGAAQRGLDFVLLETAAQQLGLKLVFTALPWRRCQADLQQGVQDGALGMSFRRDRMGLGVFPLRDGEADEGLRMRRERYSLYKLSDQPLHWDGKTLSAPSGQELVVGAQSGYSIVEQLGGMGLKVDAGTRSVEANLEKLLRGRVQAVALLSGEGDEALKRDERKARLLRRLDPPLVEKSYFLVFSRAYFASHEALARRLWAELALVRESAEFKRAEAELLRD